jgi:hypothetical protein
MKKLKLIMLAVTAMLFLGMGSVSAQEKSTVIITTVTSGREITLQVVDDQDNTTSQMFKFSKDKPEQAILKTEMDKWIQKGYEIKQSYGYSQSYMQQNSSGTILNTRYETIILFKKE